MMMRSASCSIAALQMLRESICVSYSSFTTKECCDNQLCRHLCHFGSHRRLATPIADWEQLKIGGGAPPILIPQGWLLLYHGVSEAPHAPDSSRTLRYAAGIPVLDEKHPDLIRYRSPEPILAPGVPEEREGVVPNVVFPTAIDRRDDLGSPSRFDVVQIRSAFLGYIGLLFVIAITLALTLLKPLMVGESDE